jgi:4a-hydroxytetrahydrobiopterin dehydratase
MDTLEINSRMKSLPHWDLIDVSGMPEIQRVYKLKDFREALNFTDQVGELAEKEQHHPTILTEWGKATVTWWTHTARGLTPDDFNLAAQCDSVYESKSYLQK